MREHHARAGRGHGSRRFFDSRRASCALAERKGTGAACCARRELSLAAAGRGALGRCYRLRSMSDTMVRAARLARAADPRRPVRARPLAVAAPACCGTGTRARSTQAVATARFSIYAARAGKRGARRLVLRARAGGRAPRARACWASRDRVSRARSARARAAPRLTRDASIRSSAWRRSSTSATTRGSCARSRRMLRAGRQAAADARRSTRTVRCTREEREPRARVEDGSHVRYGYSRERLRAARRGRRAARSSARASSAASSRKRLTNLMRRVSGGPRPARRVGDHPAAARRWWCSTSRSRGSSNTRT